MANDRGERLVVAERELIYELLTDIERYDGSAADLSGEQL